ncbi:glycosyltransferase family 32 protein [Elysia marginata]|uniref:Glycosyltransferase family 32 protein n=1 Tax=Elysia marginata TaxID=1093978 RepID=A0AAV4J875_9GAST|nr:glycosyltransferase family 32 protein [Elysia marginata]
MPVASALGGIYLDGDQLVTASLTPLMHHEMVMSHENSDNLANSMMLAAPAARILPLWLSRYRNYNSSQWGAHSTYVPWELAQQYPHLIKVVDNLFVNPDLTDITQVYYGQFDISCNFGLHLYTRFLRKPLPLLAASKWKSSLGRMWRKILFGTPDIVCPEKSLF